MFAVVGRLQRDFQSTHFIHGRKVVTQPPRGFPRIGATINFLTSLPPTANVELLHFRRLEVGDSTNFALSSEYLVGYPVVPTVNRNCSKAIHLHAYSLSFLEVGVFSPKNDKNP